MEEKKQVGRRVRTGSREKLSHKKWPHFSLLMGRSRRNVEYHMVLVILLFPYCHFFIFLHTLFSDKRICQSIFSLAKASRFYRGLKFIRAASIKV